VRFQSQSFKSAVHQNHICLPARSAAALQPVPERSVVAEADPQSLSALLMPTQKRELEAKFNRDFH
jgi:hypothetical protein